MSQVRVLVGEPFLTARRTKWRFVGLSFVPRQRSCLMRGAGDKLLAELSHHVDDQVDVSFRGSPVDDGGPERDLARVFSGAEEHAAVL